VITKTKFDKRMVNKKPVVQPYRRSDHKEIPSYNVNKIVEQCDKQYK
jgi:hypothetical protein